MLAMAILLQTGAVAGPPAGPPADIPKRLRATGSCAADRPPEGDEIVVCATPQDAFRLKPLPERYTAEKAPPKAEMKVLGDAKLSAEAEQGADAQGGPINRAMVRLKIPF